MRHTYCILLLEVYGCRDCNERFRVYTAKEENAAG